VRVNFNYFISEPVFEFILDAVDLAAAEGWRLLAEYRFDASAGLWTHAAGPPEPPLSLRDIGYADARVPRSAHRHLEAESALPRYLMEARVILGAQRRVPDEIRLGADFEHLRWFWLPHEIGGTPAAT
jgi:hypothetical protein